MYYFFCFVALTIEAIASKSPSHYVASRLPLFCGKYHPPERRAQGNKSDGVVLYA